MIAILDFGSQYTQLIARKIRELGIYSEILPFNITHLPDETEGIILSGGPRSVYESNSPKPNVNIFKIGIPILGICYGAQLIASMLGGKVSPGVKREYGHSSLTIIGEGGVFDGLPQNLSVWMSHGDIVEKLPKGFTRIAKTENCRYAAFMNFNKKIYALQFHPEVAHTKHGKDILKNFLFKICKSKRKWSLRKYIDEQIRKIRERVKNERAICAVSGGVDSTTAALMGYRSIGNKLTCLFVDNGLLRKNERETVISTLKPIFGKQLKPIDARTDFLQKLKGITEPEEKRKIIGETFIRIFEKYARGIKFLIQGTLYPDVIESTSVVGPSEKIKTHHNVGGIPTKLEFEIIEPLKYLFKDEVRKIALQLGLPAEIANRHPFPGPGLAVRIIGEVNSDRLEILRKADSIVEEEIKSLGIYNKVWQAFAVLLPFKSVGVMGDQRSYQNVIALRIVSSSDGMTADFWELPYQFLRKISSRIINEVEGVNRVVYDITTKPPATIEWE